MYLEFTTPYLLGQEMLMQWFHFTDFHTGKPKGPQTTALGSLIDVIKRTCETGKLGKIDAVFLTGDIAFSGNPEEFDRFRDDFLIPLRNIPGFEDTLFFSSPGNHDIDCDASTPIAWSTIGPRNQEVYFCEAEAGLKARNSRVPIFEAYCNFVKKNNIYSPDPAKEVSTLISDLPFPFDVLITNTAFFSDRQCDSSGETTPSPIESLRLLLGARIDAQKPVVILAHHPIACFMQPHQAPMLTFLNEKKAVFLHGHIHAPSISVGQGGIVRTLGFGACYQANLQQQTNVPYMNTFTHCRLDNDELLVRSFSWQASKGTWFDSTTVHFPDWMQNGPLIGGEPLRMPFPCQKAPSETGQSNAVFRSVQRRTPKPTRIIPIEAFSAEMSNRLFSVSENISSIFQKGDPLVHSVSEDDGNKNRFELEELDNGKRHFLIFIGAINHVLSAKEVEAINTELDTEGFASATVISLGKISDDAKSMYLRLRARKPIEVLVNEGLTAEADQLMSDQQRMILATLDAAHNSICLLLGSKDIYLLITDETKSQQSFYVVSPEGSSLASTDPVVADIRKCDPDFAAMSYASDDSVCAGPEPCEFHVDQYLTQCHKEYNVMKYAGLANVGLRFSDLPFDELYVSASASEVSDKARRSEQLIGDHLASYPVSGELREQIQNQLLASVNQEERHETSQARDFCQKYCAVLITGDPGSGKTCFVKSEILAYCKRGIDAVATSPGEQPNIDWHSSHVPIMVPLSEVVAEKDLEEKGIFVIAARLLERRGLLFPIENMRRFALQGRIAFFFDGLDEVVSIEKRALVVKLINDLVVEYLPTGNRFVVTSRPAAVQVVNLLPSLHKLELLGLTDSEIRMLAMRLLKLKLAATQGDVLVGEASLNEKDHTVISQLIKDCKKNPGVARMAQNPLLLTLLIMIYANSGAPSAKRHLIYAEAIDTLASVRGREAGHHPISSQDLRERLGAIALSVYKKESGLLPHRSEVCDIVKSVMERQLGETVSRTDANLFIQRVAESTGLIAFEKRKGEEDGRAVVTFMHHSFLEYFAAIGLSRELDSLVDIGELVREPRWREILTLLAGIIGENSDVSPIIKRFISSGNPAEPDVDAKLLLFAIDCALECEVPSEAAQRILSNSIKECLVSGPGRLDPWVRKEIGQRLNYLLSVCGGSEFNNMIAGLIAAGDEHVSAATIEVIGYACSDGYESQEITTAFEKACSRIDDAVQSAICSAVSRSRVLRTNAALQVVASCLNKTRRNRLAAFEALANIPSLASEHWEKIIGYIDDVDARTSKLASIAAMHAGLNVDLISLTGARKDLLLRALNNVDFFSGSHEEFNYPQMKKDTLDRLLASALLTDRTLGIRLLPLAEGEERYIYDMLTGLVRGKSTPREEVVAALIALRRSGSVLDLFTLADLKTIGQLLDKGTSDVRIAAANLLGYFGKEMIAVDALLLTNFRDLSLEDYCARIAALSRAQTALERVKSFIFGELRIYLDDKKKMSSDNLLRIKTLLDAARRLGGTAPAGLSAKVLELVGDFKVDTSLKQRALLCYPAIVAPSQKTVDNISDLFKRPLIDMDEQLVQLPAILAKKCKSSVDYVVASVGALSGLRSVLLVQYAKYSKRQVTEDNEYCIAELRNGIAEVTQIIVAFKDFIGTSTPVSKPSSIAGEQ